jgi:hypothetical protein
MFKNVSSSYRCLVVCLETTPHLRYMSKEITITTLYASPSAQHTNTLTNRLMFRKTNNFAMICVLVSPIHTRAAENCKQWRHVCFAGVFPNLELVNGACPKIDSCLLMFAWVSKEYSIPPTCTNRIWTISMFPRSAPHFNSIT